MSMGDKGVPIRIKPQTRARLHRIKHVGQTLDGIITELIDLWEAQKRPKHKRKA